jgi:hypothetical protein
MPARQIATCPKRQTHFLICVICEICGLTSFLSKKSLQDLATLVLSHSPGDLTLVILGRHLEEIDHAARPAGLLIRATINHTPEPGVDDCSGAHRAWLLSDIEVAVV